MTVKEIKARHEERKWADIEGILRTVQPAMEAHAKARRKAEARKAMETQRQQAVDNARTALVSMALSKAGMPVRGT